MSDKTPVEKIQFVAHQLTVMAAGAPPQGGLAGMLKTMAIDLNSALAALGHRTGESVHDGMARSLSQHGVYGVNPLFLGVTYEGHPDIAYLIQEGHDWADPAVVDKVIEYCFRDMLGISYDHFRTQWNVNRTGLISRFMKANEVWI